MNYIVLYVLEMHIKFCGLLWRWGRGHLRKNFRGELEKGQLVWLIGGFQNFLPITTRALSFWKINAANHLQKLPAWSFFVGLVGFVYSPNRHFIVHYD